MCGERPVTDGEGTCVGQCGKVGFGAPDNNPCYWYLVEFARTFLLLELLAAKVLIKTMTEALCLDAVTQFASRSFPRTVAQVRKLQQ